MRIGFTFKVSFQKKNRLRNEKLHLISNDEGCYLEILYRTKYEYKIKTILIFKLLFTI